MKLPDLLALIHQAWPTVVVNKPKLERLSNRALNALHAAAIRTIERQRGQVTPRALSDVRLWPGVATVLAFQIAEALYLPGTAHECKCKTCGRSLGRHDGAFGALNLKEESREPKGS